jgi:hypothetical protein
MRLSVSGSRNMLACEECWQEVQMAHRGRVLAESLREVAPPAAA